MITVKCKICKENFKTYPSVIKKGGGKCCSNICKHKASIIRLKNNPHSGLFQKGHKPWNKEDKVTVKCLTCGENFDTTLSKIRNGGGKYCKTKCYWESKKESMKGKKHWNWKDGKSKTVDGYIRIWSPNHPFATRKKQVLQSRLVAEKALNRYIIKEESIHHINGKKNDDRLENLYLFSTNGEHTKHHCNQDKKTGRFTSEKVNPILISNLI